MRLPVQHPPDGALRLRPGSQQRAQSLLLRISECGPLARLVPPRPERVNASCTNFSEPIAHRTGADTEGCGHRPPSPPRRVQFDRAPPSPLFCRC
jgi:hypothetical protein